MVVDAAILMRSPGAIARAPGLSGPANLPGGSAPFDEFGTGVMRDSWGGQSLDPPPSIETESDRAARVRRISESVRAGRYNVQAHRLALALLDWDPRRASPKGSPEANDRRRTYMRDYMRKRRAGTDARDEYAFAG
jgi:hypothetical protein